MDKRKKCYNINRNTNLFNHLRSKMVRNNSVSPEIFVSEIWMQEDARNGVEIIELTSSNSDVEESIKQNKFSQAWGLVNNNRLAVDTEYRLNNIASERTRKNRDDDFFVSYANEYVHDHDTQANFDEFNFTRDSENMGVSYNNQISCFTIINNHIIDSNSSSDNDDVRVEEITTDMAENIKDNKYWDHVYKDDDLAIYNTTGNSDKSTIGIYSFKNRRHLTEHDFQLVNIPSTSPSLSDDEWALDTDSNVRRTASPIPTYIPRLDLSLAQTLSTVTEISELKKSEDSLIKKPINNWLTERNKKKCTKEVPDVINWMALSPRERRWRYTNRTSNMSDDRQDKNDTFNYAEGSKIGTLRKIPAVLQVDVDVHSNECPEKPADTEEVSTENIELEPVLVKQENTTSTDISCNESDPKTENDSPSPSPKNIPYIKISKNKTYDIITEPIENLNSDKWIGEDKVEQTPVCDVQGVNLVNEELEVEKKEIEEVPGSQRLWVKQMELMKPPMWTSYLPIAATPPQFYLSLSSIESKRSWYTRITKYFNCCK